MSDQQKRQHFRREGLGSVQRRRSYPWLIQGLCLLLLLIPGAGWATWVEDSWITRFDAPTQSMWAAGGTSGFNVTEGFNEKSGPFLASGNVTLSASAGTVSGNVEGLLKTSYEDYLSAPGDALFRFQYTGTGIENESKLSTNLGVDFTFGMNFGVDFPWYTFIPDVNVGGTLLDTKLSLHSDTDFTYVYDKQIKGTAEYAPTIGSLGFDAVVAGINADLKLTQDAYFTPEGSIGGFLNYTHLETGTFGQKSFSAAEDGAYTNVMVPLNLPGYWALTLNDLTLSDNSFYTDIGLDLGLSMWATILGTTGFSFGFDVFRDTPFALTFNEVDSLGGSLLVYVDDPNADPTPDPGPAPHGVPEPGTLWLLAVSLVSLIAVRRH
jgi:hypothetical protein